MTLQKIHTYGLCLFSTVFLLASCNQDEGFGGSSSVEGYVYNVVHYDDSFVFRTDTFPAVREDVYLIFGDNVGDYYGKDVKTDYNGLYRFDYLRKGNYIVYACFNHPEGFKEAVSRKIKVGGNVNKAEPIYIHSGKAYGTAMVSGLVEAVYYHNGNYRDEGTGSGMRAYIRHKGESLFFNDARVTEGHFVFQKLVPGQYEIAVENQDMYTEKIDLNAIQTVIISETGKIYELPKVFHVIKCV